MNLLSDNTLDDNIKEKLAIIAEQKPEIAKYFLVLLRTKNEHYQGNVDRLKQLRILVNLLHDDPNIFRTLFGKSLNSGVIKDGAKGDITGMLFERLAAAEFRLEKLDAVDQLELPSSNENQSEQLKLRLKIASELVRVWQNPDWYGFGKKLKNPDLAYIQITDQGTVVIEALGEVKLGDLDYRCYTQLVDSGFKDALNTLLQELNGPNSEHYKQNLLKKGLVHLANAGEIKVDDNLVIHLVTTSNRPLAKRGGRISRFLAKNLINTRKFKSQQFRSKIEGQLQAGESPTVDEETFIKLLMDESKVQIRRSNFSHNEVMALYDHMAEECRRLLSHDIDSQSPPTQTV